MELTKTEIRRALEIEAPSATKLPRSGTLLADFNALQLARALETEVLRARVNGLTKIRLTIDLQEALDLANRLRRSKG
jgi:hypothetical protein